MPSQPSLSRSADFRRVRRWGSRTRRDGLMVYRLRRGDLDPARVGLSVGRRCGGAVARNRLKRRMRAACRQVELPAGVDLVLHAEPDAAGLAFQEMVEAVEAGAGSP